ncbi:MAG: sulfatase-like hydrolase/transferase, partial [Terracidiphilus sp.]
YLGYSYPHDPARASERFRGKTKFGNVGDAIAEIDWSVGEILQAVERKGQAANTLVCFTSDHGPWYQGCPGLLRGRKASTFEGGFRVPFIARWPGKIAAGATMDAWCSNLDVLPTLAALCGLEHPEKPLDGIDISGLLTGHGHVPERKPILYFSPMGNGGNNMHCIRRGDWKLRVAQCTGGRGWAKLDGAQHYSTGEIYVNDRTTGARQSAWLERPELYNLARDPAESYDVAHMEPEIVSELMQSLEAQMPSFPTVVVETYANLKQHRGDISTPPGAAPRPYKAPNPKWSWEPPDRRWSSKTSS